MNAETQTPNDQQSRMKNPTLWLYALAAVVVLNIIASLFMSPAIRIFDCR